MGNGTSNSAMPDLSPYNDLITQVNDAVTCDATCQKNQTEESLKTTWDNAQANLASAPSQVQLAKKNYITFKDGNAAYNKMQQKQLQEEAGKIAKDFENTFNEYASKIDTQLGTYEGLLLNFKNVADLYLKYKEENEQLKKDLKETANDVITNERKTFYQDQQIDKMKFYYYHIILVLYIICVLAFGFFALIYPSKTSWKIRLATFILLVLLPFVSTYILALLLLFKNFLLQAIPKMAAQNKLFHIFNI